FFSFAFASAFACTLVRWGFSKNEVYIIQVQIDSPFVSFNMERYQDGAEVIRYVLTMKPAYLTTPEIIQPTDWTVITSAIPSFQWKSVEGASSYQIQIATEDTFQLSIIDSATITQTLFISDSLKIGKTYFWRVRATNPSHTSPWSAARRFRIDGIDITDRLVLFYPFDGSPEDSVGNSDGTLMGDAILVEDRFRNPNQAYSFDGDEDYITFPESEEYTTIDREITVATWIYPRSRSFEMGVMHRDGFWRLFLNGDGSVVGNIFNETGNERRVGSSRKAPLSTWSLVAFTYDQQKINVYVNGKHSGALEYSISQIGEKGEPSILTLAKGFGNSQNDFNGTIDEVRVYDRALSHEEMAELYRKTATENFPPEIVTFSPTTADTTITEGDSIEFSVDFQDEDNDTLYCTWSYNGNDVFIDTTIENTSAFQMYFPFGSDGLHLVGISVTDGKLTVEKSWTVTVNKKAPPKLMVHYMPWYQAKPERDFWGWHWTMDFFNPDKKDANGKREIASQYYPLTGPYDSNDKDILEYQVLLMKLSGIDGVIADWYGKEDFWDYGLINESTHNIFQYAKKAGLYFAVCYEDKTIKNMIDNNHISENQAIDHGQQVMQYLEQNWFSDTNHLNIDDQPVFMVYGPQYFKNAADWENIFSVLSTAPQFFTLDHLLSPIAAGAYPWPPMWKSTDGILSDESLFEYQNDFYDKSPNWDYLIAGAFPGFNDIYEQAGLGFSCGFLDDKNGATFSATFQKALDSHPEVIQIITWNDYGEGTKI
ncbi:hypothetical protein H8E88_26410, partial [candidate division KSB1 bacterium]|nr:hypothetical protein [candidate division KSB1 bacterium]